ncbi:hypothetical protein PTKIN_Ptkin01aG0326800 [Pterospermum kingtungense]
MQMYMKTRNFKLIIFLWKICTNCLPVRAELHRRVQRIPPECVFCLNNEESVEHLFFECTFARAFWFGSELSLRTDGLGLNSVKEWIGEWLGKPELLNPEALWFYGQFVCGMWSIWLHMNEVLFKNTKPQPLSALTHLRAYMGWIYKAYSNLNTSMGRRENQHACSNLFWINPNIPCEPQEASMVFIAIQRNQGTCWFGSSGSLGGLVWKVMVEDYQQQNQVSLVALSSSK